VPSFYSLERDNSWAKDIPATPDGRRSGTPISENQSPTYGSDRNGITALLCSISKLPFTRTGAGGLNLTFSSSITPEVLGALIKGYFEQGGLHVGISVIDREVLLDAMEHPENHQNLVVRVGGYSDIFVNLPIGLRQNIINRTMHSL
jgi:formate C-acetyltransferase